METNGKNLKMFMYVTHDYMDMYPEEHFATFKTYEDAKAAVDGYRELWNSGTVSEVQEVSPAEFLKHRNSNYWKGYEDVLDRAAEDCTEEWYQEYMELMAEQEAKAELSIGV